LDAYKASFTPDATNGIASAPHIHSCCSLGIAGVRLNEKINLNITLVLAPHPGTTTNAIRKGGRLIKKWAITRMTIHIICLKKHHYLECTTKIGRLLSIPG
jgi:hypothetical protein